MQIRKKRGSYNLSVENLKYKYMFDNISNDNEIFKIGVYKLYHVSCPEKIYVGSASSTSRPKRTNKGFYDRLRGHISYFVAGRHPAKELAALINEKGIEGLRMSLVELCNDRETCLDREQYYLDSLRPYYNSYTNSRCGKGFKVSDETRLKLSANSKGRKYDPSAYDSRKKPAYQFDLLGNYIACYKGSLEASIATGIKRKTLLCCLSGFKKSAGGFIWSYTPEIQVKLIVQKDTNGIVINKFYKKEEVIKATKIKSYEPVLRCLRGKQELAHGYVWEYEIIKSVAA